MKQTRPYQERAIVAALATPDPFLLVGVTGSGKTFMAAEIIRRHGGRSLCIAHRTELIDQLADATGADSMTIQGLLSKPYSDEHVELLVVDEAHHMVAEEWSKVLGQFPGAKLVGLTATPPPELGKVFKKMHVAAYHSDLLRDGFLCDCDVFQPGGELGDGVALHPVKAFRQYGRGKCFLFAPSVKLSKEWCEQFNQFGIKAAHVDGTTDKAERAQIFDGFKHGETQVLCNVDIATEGVDVPQAETVILARGFGSQAAFLQATGRVLRPFPGKSTAIAIDLTGCTHKHGFPTDDRAYELGKDIKSKEALTPLRNCTICGYTQASAKPTCGRCGHEFEKEDPRVVKIRNEALMKARNESTSDDDKKAELRRWVDRANQKGVHYYILAKKYREKYGVKPDLGAVCTEEEKKKEHRRLVQRFGYGKGSGMWKGMFK